MKARIFRVKLAKLTHAITAVRFVSQSGFGTIGMRRRRVGMPPS
jgi:hypothetical protein